MVTRSTMYKAIGAHSWEWVHVEVHSVGNKEGKGHPRLTEVEWGDGLESFFHCIRYAPIVTEIHRWEKRRRACIHRTIKGQLIKNARKQEMKLEP